MRYLRNKVFVFCLIIFAGYVAKAGEKGDTKLTKNISRSFSIETGDDVEVINKYGKIIVNTWDKDSAKFSIDIVATGKTDDIVEKLMDKVYIDFSYAVGFLTVETDMDKKRGAFSSVLSNIDDYSKTFNSRNKVTIDYTIYLPEGVNLKLDNKFGNLFINDFAGELDVKLSHGDLKTRDLQGKSEIELSFGNGTIKNLKDGTVKLKGAELGVDKASKISIQSSSSEVTLGEIAALKINSRNDQYRVDEVTSISGSGVFTDVAVAKLGRALDLNLDYGEVFVDQVDINFKSVAINSKSADISLVLNPQSYFSAKISGQEDRMIVPNSMLSLRKNETANSELDFSLEGMVGNTREDNIGSVDIIANNADLIISIVETPIFTNRD